MANEDKQNGIMSYSFGKPMAVEEEKAFSWYKDKGYAAGYSTL